MKNFKLSDCRVFIDFDNTITVGDVLYDLIKRYSTSTDWMALEKDWQLGEITTKECLIGQLKRVKISKADLSQYLANVTIDPSFTKLMDLLRSQGVVPVIASDNFESIIAEILANNNIKGVPVFANRLKHDGDRLFLTFPHQNPDCPFCAHCKKTHFINDRTPEHPILYIGDGRSDICPAMEADIVFAKDTLLAHLKKNQKPCFEFSNLGDILENLKGRVYEPASIR